MNQTAPVLTSIKRNYLFKACMASLFGAHQLDQSLTHYLRSITIQLIAVIQTYLISKLINSYTIVLIVPAAINLVLQLIDYLMTPNRKCWKQQFDLLQLVILQSIGTSSAIYYQGNIIDAIVYFFMFPREQSVEMGFTQQESYSRARYSVLFLKLILILTHVNRMIVANIIRIIYYFTPILIWIGLFGQFTQFLEYVIEQFNFFMGSSLQATAQRTYLTMFLNVILIAICLGFSYTDEYRLAICITGFLVNIKSFNIFLFTNNKDPKQLFKSTYIDRSQKLKEITFTLINTIVIFLCGFLASTYYRELFYAIIPLQIIFWIILFTQPNDRLKLFKVLITAVQFACISMMDYDFEGIFAQRLFNCTTVVRLFSLIISNPNYLFFEQLVCFIVSFKTDYSMADCQQIGFLVQVAIRALLRIKSRLGIWVIANQKMLTVKKQKVTSAALITALQIIMLPLTFCIMLISSVLDSPYMPFLGLPLFHFASVRPYRNSQINQYIAGSSEGSIYNAFLAQAFDKLLTALPTANHYLIRIGKYIGILQLLEYSGGYAVIQFKGLESQETTSCHGIEAREVDRLVESRDCMTALTLQRQFTVTSYEENQIILTGIIEATDFVSGFKRIYLKMLCNYAQQLSESNQKSILKLSREFDSNEKHFPNDFASTIKLPSKFQFDYAEPMKTTPSVRVQIKHDDDDIMGMLDDFVSDIPKKIQKQPSASGFFVHVQRAILYLYQISLQDLDFNFEMRLNQKLLYELFQSPKALAEKRQMQGVESIFSEIVTQSIRAALKLSVDIYSIEGHLAVDDTQLIEELNGLNDCYVGIGSEEGWQKAMQCKLQLWSLGYEASKNKLTVYRNSHTEIQCQMFRFESEVIRGIESNLQFELLFATNDDEERYSIQTHEQFFRNMIIEGSELPLGYAPFYSGPVMISLR